MAIREACLSAVGMVRVSIRSQRFAKFCWRTYVSIFPKIRPPSPAKRAIRYCELGILVCNCVGGGRRQVLIGDQPTYGYRRIHAAPYARLGFARRRQKNNPRPTDMLLRRTPRRNNRLKRFVSDAVTSISIPVRMLHRSMAQPVWQSPKRTHSFRSIH